jgi:hypothetical protein
MKLQLSRLLRHMLGLRAHVEANGAAVLANQ